MRDASVHPHSHSNVSSPMDPILFGLHDCLGHSSSI